MTDPAPPPDPAPPAPPVVSDDLAQWVDTRIAAAVAGDLPIPDALAAWLDARVQAAIAEAVPALGTWLLANEPALLAPLTAYMDAKIAQIEATLPPIIAAAIKNVLPHWLHEVAPKEEQES